jgi:adenylate cyclase
MAATAVANLVGLVVVVSCITWVLPGGEVSNTGRVIGLNAILGGAFLLLVVPAATIWSEAWLRSARRWLQEGRDPTEREVTAVLHTPIRLFTVHVTTWTLAAVGFGILNGVLDIDLLARVSITILLGGFTTSGFVYLLAERITRPLAAAALSRQGVTKPKLPGVTARTMIAWMMGSGIPLVGLTITGVFALVDDQVTVTQLAISMLVIGALGLVVGGWVSVLGARAVADPVISLRQGIDQLAAGDLTTRVDVFDGSVLGLVQAGFNDMATGLEERERLRDLYQRQVGEEVARDSLEREWSLGGETTDVAALFVDVLGSTQLASERPASEVVELLNRFFGVVVDEVHAQGGWINKFQGDATLAVFGAPNPLDDAAGRALAAARRVGERLPVEVPQLAAGVGVAYGPVVAGNVGDERRFEFTVIGDPVNEAARLTELAKRYQPMVLASADALRAASAAEREHWKVDGEAALRGRSRPTRLARPIA